MRASKPQGHQRVVDALLQASACAADRAESCSTMTTAAEALAASPEAGEETALAEEAGRRRTQDQAARESESQQHQQHRPLMVSAPQMIPFDDTPRQAVDPAGTSAAAAPSRSTCSSPAFFGVRSPGRVVVVRHTPPSARAQAPYWLLVPVERRKVLQEAQRRGACSVGT